MAFVSPFRFGISRVFARPLPLPSPFRHASIRLCVQPSFRPDADAAPLPSRDESRRVDEAVRLAFRWTSAPGDRGLVGALAGNELAVSFVMKFTDWVMRAEDPAVARRLLRRLISRDGVPGFLGVVDRALMQVRANVTQIMPSVVLGAARWRMREFFVAGFVGTVEKMDLKDGQSRNLNLLGEAVLGDLEAKKRREEALELFCKDGVDYVSVKDFPALRRS